MTASKTKITKSSKVVVKKQLEQDAIIAPVLSKQARVISLLQTGASIGSIQEITGWQPHSVRGFLSAVVRKKLGHKLVSDRTSGERIYRIAA